VAYPADERDAGRRNCSRDDFFIESPEFFQTTTPARNDDDVYVVSFVKRFDRGRDLRGCYRSLHLCGGQQNLHQWETAIQDVKDVTQGGRCGRRHDANNPWEAGKRSLPLRSK
jgi:hypothetical protein